MRNVLLFLIMIVSFSQSFAEDSECRYFKNCGSRSTTSSGKNSSPSVSSAGRSNPTIVSKIKGFGIESLYVKNNPVEFNIVTGNGKFGGMLSSSSGENSFFGNRTIELDDDYWSRAIAGKKYKNKKLQLALGAGIISKKHFEFNIGISGIKNQDTKKINYGYAVSGRVFFLNFGYYKYKDDIKLNLLNHLNLRTNTTYDILYSMSTYQETYDVSVMTAGTSIFNLAIDAALIKTQYKFYNSPTQISILSSSLSISKFLINFALRNEFSDNIQIQNGIINYQIQKQQIYYGIQFLPNKHLLLGLGYNNYLMQELSTTLTLFI